MREKIENFIAMSGATLLIAVGTYFLSFQTTSHLAESPVLPY